MKLFSRRTDNSLHNSRQVAKCPTNLVHGIAGAKPSARYDSLVSDLKSQLGNSQDLGSGPLLTGQYEHTDKLGAGEACGTDDVAVSEVRHTAVTNSMNSVFKRAFFDLNKITIYDLDIFNNYRTIVGSGINLLPHC